MALSSDNQKAIISQLLSTDVELQKLARQFVLLGMKETVDQLQRGDPVTRAAIARSLSSIITKAITETAEGDGDDTLRAEMHAMMDEMRGEVMGREDDDSALVKRSVKIVPKT